MKKCIINVKGGDIAIVSREEQDYISLTDMVKNFDGGGALIEQWLKNKDTVLFLGVWEQLNNPEFNSNSPEFEGIRSESERLTKLNNIAISQMQSLLGNESVKKLSAVAGKSNV